MLFARKQEEILSYKPDILAVSSVSQVIGDAETVANICKDTLGCLCVLGGYHVSALPHKLPASFDIGVIGEGENTFSDIVRQFIDDGHEITGKLNKFEGICFHSNGSVVINHKRRMIDDIDSLPHPLRHGDFAEDAYVFSSRGCPYRCRFCASCRFWGNIRYHSADYVLEEFRLLTNRYKVKSIYILDDVFISDRNRFFSIVEGVLKEGINRKVSFHGFVRANLIDEEIVSALKKMNFHSIRFGAESGSEKVLNYLKKGSVTVEQNQKTIDLCYKYALPVGGSFVFGTPGETEADLDETINFLRHNKDKVAIMGFYLLQAVPGTELWEWAKKKGLVSEDMDWSKLTLDLLKKEFSWDDINYLNNDVVPLERFKVMISNIKQEFIESYEKRSLARNVKRRIVSVGRRFGIS